MTRRVTLVLEALEDLTFSEMMGFCEGLYDSFQGTSVNNPGSMRMAESLQNMIDNYNREEEEDA